MEPFSEQLFLRVGKLHRRVMKNIYKSLARSDFEFRVQLWNPVPKH